MKSRLPFGIIACIAFLAAALALNAATPANVAIFVSNRAGSEHDAKLLPLEDFVSSRVAEHGLQVISRETSLNAVRQLDPGTGTNAVDQAMINSTSALRLAQNLGANYLLQVTISGVDSRSRNVKAYGVDVTNTEHTLRVSYKVLDGGNGAAVMGDTVKATKTIQQNANSSEEYSDLINGLLDDASQKVADSVSRKIASLPPPSAPAGQAEIEVVIQTAEATLIVKPGQTAETIGAVGFTAQVDGVAMGTVPGRLRLNKGLSRLRVTHADYEPWEQQISAVDGQVITVVMNRAAHSRSEQKSAAMAATGIKLADKHISRITILGALVLIVLGVAVIVAFVFRARRMRAVAAASVSTTEIKVKNTNINS